MQTKKLIPTLLAGLATTLAAASAIAGQVHCPSASAVDQQIKAAQISCHQFYTPRGTLYQNCKVTLAPNKYDTTATWRSLDNEWTLIVTRKTTAEVTRIFRNWLQHLGAPYLVPGNKFFSDHCLYLPDYQNGPDPFNHYGTWQSFTLSRVQ